MKILRLFDSLKFLRTIFVAVACAFFIFPAHAELQDTELPVGYRRLQDITTNGGVKYESQVRLTGNDTLKFSFKSVAGNLLGSITATDADNNYSFYPSTSSTGKYARYNGQTGGSSILSGTRYDVIMSPTGVTGIRNPSSFTPREFTCSNPFYIFTISSNNTPISDATIYGSIEVSGTNNGKFIPAERVSDGEIGYFDTIKNVFLENQGSGTPTTSGYDDSHMVEVPIKIATTHYNETKFAPVETRLDAAVAAVNTVVTQTMSQAQAIDTIATTKQTRPDEGCDAKYCLLVEDEQGVPHWYPIAGANGVAHALPAGYTELQYLQSNGNQYIDIGVKADLTTRAEFTYKFYEASIDKHGALFGTRDGQNSNAFIVGTADGMITLDASSTFFAQFDSAQFNSVAVPAETGVDLSEHTVQLSRDGFVYDGVTYRTFSNPTPFTTSRNILVFGYDDGVFVNSNSIRSAKVIGYGFKLWQNDVLVRNLIPAKRNSDNEIGMYDLADPNPSTAFYTNAGTGTFTAGPEM